MKRRTYLAAVAAATPSAGCISRIASGTSHAVNKVVTVENTRGFHESTSITVAILDEEISPDSTARLSLTYTNDGDRATQLQVQPERPAPVHSTPIDEMPALLLLSDAFSADRTSPRCWKPERAPAVRPVKREYTLEPGHRIKMEYAVWASPQQDSDCIQTKTYQFKLPKAAFDLRITE